MNISAATAFTWNSSVAWSRLHSSRVKLAESLTSESADNGTLTTIRATIQNAASEISRVEAARATELARIRNNHQTIDVMV
ncbi:hypothetical protein AB0F72_36730 [Actinoplanes sp. NPDC023936]|uniref:hypothetical protein n=1 Tax=Actinoplanes sp. NPDC023936 TaxID=3154910 RepID=UPI0033EDFC05